MSDPTLDYSIRQCANDVIRILEKYDGDMSAARAEATPYFQKLLKRPDLLQIGTKREGNHTADSQWLYYDYELLINTAKLPEAALPVHNHGTWELIAVYKGALKYHEYERDDDDSEPNYSKLRVVQDKILRPGDVAICAMPPHDIHSFRALTADTVIMAAGGQFAPIRQYHNPEENYYIERNEKSWLREQPQPGAH
jgi:predicted metal-dependent enzyme (double-stranded beta helix superfamily)